MFVYFFENRIGLAIYFYDHNVVSDSLYKAIIAKEMKLVVENISTPHHELFIEKNFCLLHQIRKQIKPSCQKCLLALAGRLALKPNHKNCNENLSQDWDTVFKDIILDTLCHNHYPTDYQCIFNTIQLSLVPIIYFLVVLDFAFLITAYVYSFLLFMKSLGYPNLWLNAFLVIISIVFFINLIYQIILITYVKLG